MSTISRAIDKIRLLGFTTLHDSRRYTIPRCLILSYLIYLILSYLSPLILSIQSREGGGNSTNGLRNHSFTQNVPQAREGSSPWADRRRCPAEPRVREALLGPSVALARGLDRCRPTPPSQGAGGTERCTRDRTFSISTNVLERRGGRGGCR